jgi:mycothione reductase
MQQDRGSDRSGFGDPPVRHHDLVIIGAGSGNAIVDDSFSDLDVAIIEHGDFGGTCLNVGCIPTKMLAYTAEIADTVRTSPLYDVETEPRGLHWRQLRDRVFGRLDPIAADGRADRENTSFITVYPGHARFTGPRALRVRTHDGDQVDTTADQVVVAAGARPAVPAPVTESGLPYETSDTIMRIDRPPGRLAVLGGGYIAAELAHVFASAGSHITMIDMAEHLLGAQDRLVAREFTELARSRYDLHLGREVSTLDGEPGALRLALDDGTVVLADMLLVATGRVPNGDRLDLHTAGIETHDDGRIKVDRYQRTTAAGVFALGDVCTPVQLKHVANREARTVAHNLRHPEDPRAAHRDPDVIPAAVFTSPQVASVGRTEEACRDEGLDYAVGLTRYSEVAYGWAMENETGFCKILAEPGTGRLLGAHIMGPQAPTLIQPLVMAMTLDLDAGTLVTEPYWIHPALTEVVENALRALSTA